MEEAGWQGIEEKAPDMAGWRPGVTAATWPILQGWPAGGQLGWWGSSMVGEAKRSPLFIVGNECQTVTTASLPPRPRQ